MKKLKKLLFTLFFCSLLIITIMSGCVEEKTTKNDISTIIYVDDDGKADYTSIQEAINNAIDGNTIFVRNGTYFELIYIDKSVNLIGESNNNTIIDYKSGILISDSAILINANNCQINGFKIISTNHTSNINVINIASNNNIISNNIITNDGLIYSHKAILLDGNTMNNTVSNNTIINARNGIESFNSDNNIFSNNNLSLCEVYGIYLLDSNNNIISGNMIFNNTFGMRIQDSRENKVYKNTIMNNQNGLLFCCGSKKNMAYYNLFKQNVNYNGHDDINNQWDNGSVGNYWDDYIEKYPDAQFIDNIWDTPYNVTGTNIDRFPLVNLVIN